MRQIKRGAIEAEHPSQIADIARQMSGFEASEHPYTGPKTGVDQYLPTHDGEPAASVPIPGITAADFGVAAINSPQNIGQFQLRSIGREVGPLVDHPAVPDDDEQDESRGQPAIGENYVALDGALAYLDGQMIPLSDTDVARIQGIIIRALDLKLREDLKRVRETYKLHTSKPKRKAVPKARRRGRKAVPAAPTVAEIEPAESKS